MDFRRLNTDTNNTWSASCALPNETSTANGCVRRATCVPRAFVPQVTTGASHRMAASAGLRSWLALQRQGGMATRRTGNSGT